MLNFILCFRDCVNQYGWEKRASGIDFQQPPVPEQEVITQPSDEVQKLAEQLSQKCNDQDYCLVNNSEYVPDVCNEFVTNYLSENKHI